MAEIVNRAVRFFLPTGLVRAWPFALWPGSSKALRFRPRAGPVPVWRFPPRGASSARECPTSRLLGSTAEVLSWRGAGSALECPASRWLGSTLRFRPRLAPGPLLRIRPRAGPVPRWLDSTAEVPSSCGAGSALECPASRWLDSTAEVPSTSGPWSSAEDPASRWSSF